MGKNADYERMFGATSTDIFKITLHYVTIKRMVEFF